MAKEYRFYKISEANAEIARLEGLLAEAISKLEASTGNDSEIANQIEEVRKDRDRLVSENGRLKEQIAALTKERDDAREETNQAKANAEKHCADFDKKVKEEASKQAGAIVSQTGTPPGLVQGSTQTTSSQADAFVKTVKANVAKGMSKTEALTASVKSNPAEFLAYRAAGSPAIF